MVSSRRFHFNILHELCSIGHNKCLQHLVMTRGFSGRLMSTKRQSMKLFVCRSDFVSPRKQSVTIYIS